ncbi:YncE family protein [uncultured Roseobacter sp.]|uniref:YVTN family beta-propeller repeat protein n=1 Tax=uncultured Roseobacter sp. TaxID=114847 RepID=UPI0026326BBA|nr:YncE family protein [uncultured Roseobacter sp.]
MRRVPELISVAACVAMPVMADTAYVTCQTGDALSVIDLSAGQETARWQLPGKPAGVAVSAEAVFTVSADSKTVQRMHPGTGTVEAAKTLEGGPVGIALDPARNRLFVSDWYSARIWVLAAPDLTVLQQLVVGAAPAGLALSPDGRFLASADKEADQASVFDAQTLEPLHRISVGTRPFGLSFAPDGRLFVANVGTNDVTVADPATGVVLATIPVGDRPYGVAFAQGHAFVTNQYDGTVSVIDLETLTVTKTLSVGEYPEGIDATPDQSRIVLANWFDNTVTIIDAGTQSVIEDVETCDGPRAFGAFILGEQQ